ncbi:putative non-specific serine/threonine protein kinase [Medicago truncatula]|uniref:Putative non-specific serine/threonine protein kinase n=1 Tax=Medicago truncatula TaxID=3880 RepID=A0A396I327_MEDTR|nr:putative non-specific serine/threonine protein kinase [Medicago truncatula]
MLKLVGAIFVMLNVASVSGSCIEKERQALLELKSGLVLDNTYLLPSWDSKSDDCCAWEGIGCSNETGHVEILDLNGDQFGPFVGDINETLIELRHLKYLNLSWNLFSNSYFPELFGSLRNLRFLDLQGSFDGGRIPKDLARLSHLQYLDLSDNGLEGTIPHQLGNLSHLQYLDLSSNDLAGTVLRPLGSLSKLQELHLGYNQGLKVYFGGEWLSNLTLLTHLDLSRLPNLNSSHVWLQMIGKLPKIQELKLSGCVLSDLYLLSLSRSLLNFSTSLAILDLSQNAFSSSKIFEWVFNATTNLIELDLSYNIFKGTIPYDFGNRRNNLERLDLSGNVLHGGSSMESFSDICSLNSLKLDSNNLNEDISTILLKLAGCARYSLQDLSLHHNQITGTLPNLTIFPSLITIDISNNILSGKVPDGIPKSLESLIIKSNSLEGGIPKSFGSLCSLRSLDLSSNKLSEDLSVMLHNLSVGCAKNSLKELYLASNQIVGTVPDMSGFSSLENLFLYENLLNGTILKNSTFPYRLVNLYLDSNDLHGVITDSHFGNMSMLKYLSLSSNSLALKFSENWVPPFQLSTIYLRSCTLGPSFPKWLRSQKYLQRVEISNAGISDVVPVWFWTQATNIRFTNISYNNLTGTIPNMLIRFSTGCQVIMDSNQFEGSIPLFFRSATLLQLSNNKFSETHLFLCANTAVDRLLILDLSKNQLSRKLPDCWNHLKALEFLDLSDNTLSGVVPSSMGSLLKIKVLILRNNSLTGKLPFSLKNCTELIMLDLGDNRFSGPIPYWLGQQLQMLSLRKNHFNGSLPQSLCDITNIQLLDLSENNLSGRIFKCLKNFSAMSQNVSPNKTIVSVFVYYKGTLVYEGYDLIALLMWKGAERQFKNNKLILRSIDLSSNQLIGNIPEEIGNLMELVSLNLSNNNLNGKITSKIGRLTSLEFLDLSRNHFSGLIPPSLAQIDRLSLLNLSDNYLSGRIPIGTQLQSFNASNYEGNVDLCGKPLDKICPGDDEVVPEKPESSPEDKKPIYLSVALGFITGFWGLWGSFLLWKTWRHAYVFFEDGLEACW